jgi:dipeptide/tripeptide permease
MNDPDNNNNSTHTNSNHARGLSVSPSPFNAVKLELAVVIIAGLLLWIAVDSITNSDAAQIVILLAFGVVSAGWLVLRTHLLLRRNEKK